MREILFRGKRVYDGKWVYGDFRNTNGMSPYSAFVVTYTNEQYNEVIPETVGQYIGLTDKNGKKIFEGDILCYFYKIGKSEYKRYDAIESEQWNCSCCQGVFGFAMNGFNDLRDHDRCEIVGNIYDNPELLNQKRS